MLTIAQIVAILGLLAAFGVGQPTVDQVAIILNQQATTMQDSTAGAPSNTQPSTTASPSSSNESVTTAPIPVSQARIEIVSPIPGKGLGREYSATTTEERNEGNYMVIGAIVYDAAGEPSKTALVNVTATESDQDEIKQGTGVVMNVYVDGQKRQLPVYSYTYEFHQSGKHTITFTSGDLSESVSVDVK